MKLDALIILKPYLDKILSGKKTWEIRGSKCHKRGKIALIESGSGTIVGTATLVDCKGPLTASEWNKNIRKIQSEKIRSINEIRYGKRTHAWVLKDAKRFKKPIKYKHKAGVVIWHPVKLK
jgi:hypothetical protein